MIGVDAYQLGNASFGTISEVKQHCAWLVLGWEAVQAEGTWNLWFKQPLAHPADNVIIGLKKIIFYHFFKGPSFEAREAQGRGFVRPPV